MILLKAATVALNVAFAGFVTLLVTKAVSAWQNYTQRVENAVKQSQEAVQKANQLKSSLRDLSNSYEELGDKASWGTSDFDQAKDIQEELLELLKDQDGISRDRIDKIDLQNGKYEEQLELLRQIRLEQLQGETSDLVQNKDNQGKLLEKTAKEQAHDNHSVDSFDSEMAKELAGKFGWSYDEDSGVLNFDNYDPDDADSVVKHYNELGQALDIITKKYSDADRAASGLYDAFKNDRAGIKDQVEAYNDAVSALKQNKFESDFAEWSANEIKKSTQATSEIDAKIKATKEYQDAVKEAQKTEEEWNSQGYGKYGNIDNFHRDKIDWTEENLAKYKDFVDEQNSIFPGTIEKGSYSTVLGSWDTISDEDGTEHPFAFTPMLQTDNGLVPLTEDQLWNYIDAIVEQCYDENGKLDIDKLMELDATGLKQDNNTTYSAFKGATSAAAGGSGLVPAPAANNAGQFLKGDGTWATPLNTTYNNATSGSAGLMSAGDKAKLDGIAANANNYSHPTSAGNKHIPAGGQSGQILRWSGDGSATWGPDYNTTYSDFKAATASAAGGSGLVPAPAAGKQGQYLRGDGIWATPTNTTYNDATQSVHGLMSTSDKKKLDGFGAASTYALKSDITAMYRYKGSVASTDKLPTSGQTIGDVYDVGNGMNYAWNGSNWDALGEIFTIIKITNTEIDTVLAS